MIIKTRFAPSPTGNLHIGSIRTALYSWLFAKNNLGSFILRIEDTDIKRYKENSIENIINGLKWLNIDWDEGPYFQSKRIDRYNHIINNMIKKKLAYKCYCSKEELEKNKIEQTLIGKKIKYNGKCRNLTNFFNKDNKSFVVRFRNPDHGIVKFKDKIRGTIIFNNNELDDLIIKRTDGIPTYNFCVVVDDWDMGITHVIRGEEHINNTPRQINIIKAIGARIPIYAHVSMIVNKSGEKISKRFNNIDILQYKKSGYLPEALLNYIVRLGWSYGNQEIFSLNDMKKLFNLNNISKSPSILNVNKLNWLNKYYLSKLPKQYMINYLTNFFKKKNININNGPKINDLYNIFHNRCNTLKEINNLCYIFYNTPNYSKVNLINKYLNLETKEILNKLLNKFTLINIWSLLIINTSIKEISIELNLNFSEIAMPLRLAITGMVNSPPIAYIIYLMGQKKVLKYINNAIKFILINNKHY
ncbi:glutamate--tRNA ligase [Enterobacteriaceae endosymbiont of Plateumaris consimilis]|uniref:glutamate--tRNA ligase n=1 Tax=Enterobacteriaceae endosymbiont of Plateumaris consimilis TaxID=2675794 RepID=UPI00144980E5|nr:glutamate--tRNA ligase [Enterobacteriaceae endosymbiont of Plateumaris consimilis]QJC28439.1 glutamate--tRNA ligase [Enterobacteriaceae endosymbiont of Plateumaris consimilis]